MRILITGGTGYLGSQLVQRCLEQRHELACIVRSTTNLKRLDRFKCDVTLITTRQIEEGIREFAPKIVIHTACTYARGKNTLEDVLLGNLLFPLKVLQASCKCGVSRWINTGTCLPNHINSYSLAKNQFSQWGRFYAETGKIQFLNLCLEHFYGPDAPEDNFLTWVTRKLKANEPINLTAGTQKRDFIFIEDVLDIYSKLLDWPIQESYFEVPVGTGAAPSIREVVEYLAALTQSNSQLHFGAVPFRKVEPDSHCDIKILEQLGVTSIISWQEGLRQMFGGAI